MIKRIHTLILLGALCLAFDRAEALEARRFLVMVDKGRSMSDFDPTLRQEIFDLVYSGFNDLMQPGDIYDLWYFNDKLNTQDHPPASWTPQKAPYIATRSSQFIRTIKYSRKSHVYEATDRMVEVSKDLPGLVAVLITDGSNPVRGTPFDEQINTIFTHNAKAMRNSKKPFLISFYLEKGDIKNWDVSPDVQYIQLKLPVSFAKKAPPPAEPPRPREKGIVVGKVNPVAEPAANESAAAAETTPAPRAVEPVEKPAPKPVEKPAAPPPTIAATPAPEPRPVEKPAPTAVAEPKPVQAESPKPAVNLNPPAETPASAPGRETTPAARNPEPAPAVAAAPQPVEKSAAAPLTPVKPETSGASEPARANSPAVAPEAPANPAPPKAVVATQGPGKNMLLPSLLITAVGGLLIAFWLGYMLSRRSRSTPQGSFITQSLEKKEK